MYVGVPQLKRFGGKARSGLLRPLGGRAWIGVGFESKAAPISLQTCKAQSSHLTLDQSFSGDAKKEREKETCGGARLHTTAPAAGLKQSNLMRMQDPSDDLFQPV